MKLNFCDLALKAAKEAGRIAMEDFTKKVNVIKYKRYYRDIVTKTDIKIENHIKSIIRNNFPEHGIIGEESGEVQKLDYTWIIDPLDGTVNFRNKVPFFAISIALAYKQEIILGVVYNPLLEELFVAEKGKGATLNGKEIKVSCDQMLQESTFVIAFKGGGILKEEYMVYEDMNEITRGVLRTGSAALNLAYVAAGRMTGFWSKNSPIWDVAAGIILVREAGGEITDFKGKKYKLSGGVLATNRIVHKQALEVLSNRFC